MILFFKIMLTEFIAEMGDKTQLMLIGLTSRHKMRDIILGTAVAILVLNGVAVLAGGFVSELIPTWLIKLIAAIAFLYFSLTSIGGDDDDEEEEDSGKFSLLKFAPVAVFCTFFVAEFGDKTQLTAITFGANEGMSNAVLVWIACSIGLFAADIIGMMVGYLLKSNIPEGGLGILAFVIFAIFGVVTFRQSATLLFGETSTLIKPATIAVIVVFVVLVVLRLVKSILNKKHVEE